VCRPSGNPIVGANVDAKLFIM